MPRLDVHVCVGSPFHLYGVSDVVYSLTLLFHYMPAYPQISPDTSFSRVQAI
jgi:hypothetical protein